VARYQQFTLISRNQAKLMSVPELVPDNFMFELSQGGAQTTVMVLKPIGVSRQRTIIWCQFPRVFEWSPG